MPLPPWSRPLVRGWGVLLLPLLPLIVAPEAAARRGIDALLVCLAVGWGVAAAVPPSATADPGGAPARRRGSTVRGAAVVALGVAWSVVSFVLAVRRHVAGSTNVFDLGLFENVLWNSAHGLPFACDVYASGSYATEHVSPTLLLLTPAYALVPRTETLLAAQVVAIAAAAVPLYAMARRHAGEPAAAAICCAWFLSPQVQALVLWDFHELTFAVPLALLCISTAEAGRRVWFWACFVLLMGVREELPLISLLLVPALAPSLGRRRALAATGLAVTVALAVRWFQGYVGSTGHWDGFRHLPGEPTSLAGVAGAVLNRPQLLLSALEPVRLGYILAFLVPGLGLVLLAPRLLLPASFGLFLVALTSNRAVVNPYFHYTALFLPFVFAALPVGLARAARVWDRQHPGRMRARLAAGVLTAAVTVAWLLGPANPVGTFRAGFLPLVWHPGEEQRQRAAELAAWQAAIPREAHVVASGGIGAHLAARRHLSRFPDRVDEADWVLVRPKEIAARPELPRRLEALRGRAIREHASPSGLVVLELRGPPSPERGP